MNASVSLPRPLYNVLSSPTLSANPHNWRWAEVFCEEERKEVEYFFYDELFQQKITIPNTIHIYNRYILGLNCNYGGLLYASLLLLEI